MEIQTGEIDGDLTPPFSVNPTLPEGPDPPPLVEDEDSSSRSRSSGANNYETAGNEREQPEIPETSTRRGTVIHSTHISRRDDQPLNLSIPTDSQLSQIPNSPRNYQEDRVSVINIISRERLQDIDGDRSPNGSQSPQFLHPQDDTYDDDEEEEVGSSDFVTISSGSGLSPAAGLSPGAPSTSFQGLLMAQGIMPQENGSTAQKKKLRCLDCGKEFSQLRNYKFVTNKFNFVL
jgi:hypothetical protein